MALVTGTLLPHSSRLFRRKSAGFLSVSHLYNVQSKLETTLLFLSNTLWGEPGESVYENQFLPPCTLESVVFAKTEAQHTPF